MSPDSLVAPDGEIFKFRPILGFGERIHGLDDKGADGGMSLPKMFGLESPLKSKTKKRHRKEENWYNVPQGTSNWSANVQFKRSRLMVSM